MQVESKSASERNRLLGSDLTTDNEYPMHRWGGYQTGLTIDGRQYTATLSTREGARELEGLVRPRAVMGMLPRRVTVQDDAAHWILGYETAPTNTRGFHEVDLERTVEALGWSRVSKVTPTDITGLLNHLTTKRSAAFADPVYRTTSALFGSAAADGLCPNGSPVRSKKQRPRRQRGHQPVLAVASQVAKGTTLCCGTKPSSASSAPQLAFVGSGKRVTATTQPRRRRARSGQM